MIEDYDEDSGELYGDVSLNEEEEELLFPVKAGVREFILINSKSVLMGILLAETGDSFLVALLGGVVESDKGIAVEPVVSGGEGYMRLFKSATLAISYPSKDHRAAYNKYLLEEAPKRYPKALTLLDIKVPDTTDLSEKEKVEERIKQALLNGEYFSGNNSTH